jgi:hypothetical protein
VVLWDVAAEVFQRLNQTTEDSYPPMTTCVPSLFGLSPSLPFSLSGAKSQAAQERLRGAKSKAAAPARTALFDSASHVAAPRVNGKRMHSRCGSVPMSWGSI